MSHPAFISLQLATFPFPQTLSFLSSICPPDALWLLDSDSSHSLLSCSNPSFPLPPCQIVIVVMFLCAFACEPPKLNLTPSQTLHLPACLCVPAYKPIYAFTLAINHSTDPVCQLYLHLGPAPSHVTINKSPIYHLQTFQTAWHLKKMLYSQYSVSLHHLHRQGANLNTSLAGFSSEYFFLYLFLTIKRKKNVFK